MGRWVQITSEKYPDLSHHVRSSSHRIYNYKISSKITGNSKRKSQTTFFLFSVTFGGGGSTPGTVQGLLLAALEGLYGMLGVEPGPAACKASVLPAVLSFESLKLFILN